MNNRGQSGSTLVGFVAPKIGGWTIWMQPLWFAVLILLVGMGKTPANGQKIYWGDVENRAIYRADLDGSKIEDVLTTDDVAFPFGIALDVPGKKIYWAEFRCDWDCPGRIKRANLDGSDIEIVVPDLEHCRAVAVDGVAKRLYWTEVRCGGFCHGTVRSATFDGEDIRLVVTGLEWPDAITIDEVGRKIYWSDWGTIKIQRANLDGSNVEDLVATQSNGLTVGSGTRKLYWTGWCASEGMNIWRANLDGSEVEVLVPGDLFPLSHPRGIITALGKVYWAGQEAIAGGTIRRADLDGGNVEKLLINGSGFLWGIAVDVVDLEHCGSMDADGDGDIDLSDFARFQECFGRGRKPF